MTSILGGQRYIKFTRLVYLASQIRSTSLPELDLECKTCIHICDKIILLYLLISLPITVFLFIARLLLYNSSFEDMKLCGILKIPVLKIPWLPSLVLGSTLAIIWLLMSDISVSVCCSCFSHLYFIQSNVTFGFCPVWGIIKLGLWMVILSEVYLAILLTFVSLINYQPLSSIPYIFIVAFPRMLGLYQKPCRFSWILSIPSTVLKS